MFHPFRLIQSYHAASEPFAPPLTNFGVLLVLGHWILIAYALRRLIPKILNFLCLVLNFLRPRAAPAPAAFVRVNRAAVRPAAPSPWDHRTSNPPAGLDPPRLNLASVPDMSKLPRAPRVYNPPRLTKVPMDGSATVPGETE